MGLKMPKVSVIIPTYQHVNYIAECLDSLKNQTFEDWEAVVVDDGSSDGTGDIVKDYARLDPRIKYFYQENKGIYKLNELFNFALWRSVGEFIAVLEGDDVWPQNKIEIQLHGFDNVDVGVVWGNGMQLKNSIYSPMVGYIGNFKSSTLQNKPYGIALKALAFSRYFQMPTTCVMYRTGILRRVGGFYQPKGLCWNDRSTWALLACVTEFCFLNDNLGIWRRHESQVTSGYKDVRTTFDFMIRDSDCPAILKNALMNIDGECSIVSKYRHFNRSTGFRKIGFFFKFCFDIVIHPIACFKILYFLSSK